MKQFSNLYIFCFSSVLVLVVAAALSFTSLSLKDKQEENIEIERQQNILKSLGVKAEKADVKDKFGQYITESIVLDEKGNPVKGVFPEQLVPKKMKGEKDGKKIEYFIWTKPKSDERLLPLYSAKIKNEQFVVIPVYGSGLWGPIWGNIAIKSSDMNTVDGVTFDHKSETPGLGAEIKTDAFQEQFKGKKLFKGDSFASIQVNKKGTYTPDDYSVDAISGGTITSKALEAMIRNSIEPYQKYLKSNKTK